MHRLSRNLKEEFARDDEEYELPKRSVKHLGEVHSVPVVPNSSTAIQAEARDSVHRMNTFNQAAVPANAPPPAFAASSFSVAPLASVSHNFSPPSSRVFEEYQKDNHQEEAQQDIMSLLEKAKSKILSQRKEIEHYRLKSHDLQLELEALRDERDELAEQLDAVQASGIAEDMNDINEPQAAVDLSDDPENDNGLVEAPCTDPSKNVVKREASTSPLPDASSVLDEISTENPRQALIQSLMARQKEMQQLEQQLAGVEQRNHVAEGDLPAPGEQRTLSASAQREASLQRIAQLLLQKKLEMEELQEEMEGFEIDIKEGSLENLRKPSATRAVLCTENEALTQTVAPLQKELAEKDKELFFWRKFNDIFQEEATGRASVVNTAFTDFIVQVGQLHDDIQKLFLLANKEAKEKNQQLHDSGEELSRLQEDLHATRNALVQSEDLIQKRHQQLEEVQQALAAAEARIAKSTEHVKSKDQQLDELQQALAAAEARIAESTEHVESKDQQLEEVQQALAAAEARIAESTEQLESKDKYIHEFQEALTSLESQASETNRTIRLRDQRLLELEHALKESESQVANMTAQLSDYMMRERKLSEMAQQLHGSLEEKENVLDLMEHQSLLQEQALLLTSRKAAAYKEEHSAFLRIVESLLSRSCTELWEALLASHAHELREKVSIEKISQHLGEMQCTELLGVAQKSVALCSHIKQSSEGAEELLVRSIEREGSMMESVERSGESVVSAVNQDLWEGYPLHDVWSLAACFLSKDVTASATWRYREEVAQMDHHRAQVHLLAMQEASARLQIERSMVEEFLELISGNQGASVIGLENQIHDVLDQLNSSAENYTDSLEKLEEFVLLLDDARTSEREVREKLQERDEEITEWQKKHDLLKRQTDEVMKRGEEMIRQKYQTALEASNSRIDLLTERIRECNRTLLKSEQEWHVKCQSLEDELKLADNELAKQREACTQMLLKMEECVRLTDAARESEKETLQAMKQQEVDFVKRAAEVDEERQRNRMNGEKLRRKEQRLEACFDVLEELIPTRAVSMELEKKQREVSAARCNSADVGPSKSKGKMSKIRMESLYPNAMADLVDISDCEEEDSMRLSKSLAESRRRIDAVYLRNFLLSFLDSKDRLERENIVQLEEIQYGSHFYVEQLEKLMQKLKGHHKKLEEKLPREKASISVLQSLLKDVECLKEMDMARVIDDRAVLDTSMSVLSDTSALSHPSLSLGNNFFLNR